MARLPKDIIEYIKHGTASYSQIIQQIQRRWGRSVSKSLLSYYKGSRAGRTKQFYEENIGEAEWDWLVGLYYADGCKFKYGYHYTVVFSLSLNAKEIMQKLNSILRTLGLRVGIYRKKNKKAVDVKTFSKQFFFSLPQKEERYSPQLPLAYLAGLFDGDGFIKNYGGNEKWVFTQARYLHLVQQVIDITKPFGKVTSRLISHPSSSNKPTHRVLFLKETRRALLNNEFAKYCIRCNFGGRAGRI